MPPATTRLLAASALAVAFHAAPLQAVTSVDPEGSSGSGVNDTLATAQPLGVLPVDTASLTVSGFISDADFDDVDFYQFTVAGGPVGVYFDIDLANDVGSESDMDTGLDAKLSIFDAAGTLIGFDDDSRFFGLGNANAGTDPGSDPFGDLDPFVGELTLADGIYYAAVTSYLHDPNARFQQSITFTDLSASGSLVSDVEPDATIRFGENTTANNFGLSGSYRLDIRTRFSEIPEPSALALAGLGGLTLRRRRAR